MKTIDNEPQYKAENHDDHRLAEELEALYHHVVQIDEPNANGERSHELGPGIKIPEAQPAAARSYLDPVGKVFKTRPRPVHRRYSWRSEVRRRQKARAFKKAWIAVLMVMSLLAGGLTARFIPPERVKGFAHGLTRFKNTFTFIVLRQKPHFYSLILEKNGKDFQLTSQDVLEVSYEDEFVIKGVSTDVSFGEVVTVNIMGSGRKDELREPLKGIDLVDKAVLNDRDSLEGNKPGNFSLQIAYKGEGIASIPIQLKIDPQGWLSYARSSRNEKAKIEYLKRAIAMSQEDASARKMIASGYLQAGMNREAIAQYQEFLHLKPDDEVALADMALAWGNLGNWNEAIASYQAALKIRPDYPVVNFRLGEAYEKNNQLEKAAEQYRLVMNKMPKADNVVVVLANVSIKMGNLDEAIRWNSEVVKRQPQNAHAYANLGLAYGKKGQAREEINNYQKAIALNPQDSVSNFNLGAAFEKNGLFQEAFNSYANALKLNPDLTKAVSKIKQMKDLISQQKQGGEAVHQSK